MTLTFDESRIRSALRDSWSLETAVQWTADNPASGQCNVTAVVIFDLFGGDLLRTKLQGVWHYYNRIDGQRMDLTDSQFVAPNALVAAPRQYDDAPTTRDAAMTGIPQREYDALKAALLAKLQDR